MNNIFDTRRGFIRRLSVLCTAAALAIAHPVISCAKQLGASLDGIKGLIIRKSDENYMSWWGSMVWYIFKPTLYPDLIIKAADEEDVIRAVNYARDNNLRVAVRSGGHNPARAVLRDGGMLLDLSALREVEIDATEKTAWIQPGIRSEEFIELAREKGLAFPAAHTGIVPMGGYLIGGGLGWNMPEWDIACRSILAAEIITADGKKVVATENENQDLLWAIRGAGPGFFGAVIRYKLQLFPLPKVVVKSKYLVPIEKLSAVINELEDIVKVKKDRLEIITDLGHFYPPDKPVEQQQLVCAVVAVAFANSKDEALALIEPVTKSKLSSLSLIKKAYAEISFQDLYIPPPTDYSSPNRSTVENIWTDDPGKVLLVLAERLKNSPPLSPRSFVLSAWGVNPDKKDNGSSYTYFADHYVSWYLMAEEQAHIGPNVAWMDAAVKAVEPYTRGHYINEIDPRRYPQQVQACFSQEKWTRLGQLRQRYDPGNVFHTYIGHS